MEEKELNLVELLKNCVGEKFYSRAYGEVTLSDIVRDFRPNSQEIKVYTPDPQSERIWFLRNGQKHKNGEIDLYPSRALYEKYPLDANKAWYEWAEARKLKSYLIVKAFVRNEDETGICIINERFTFNTKEEAKQAAEVVREALQKLRL